MHLSTMSARLSRLLEWPFSVAIQHSVAARAWVIGGSGGLSATGAAPVPVVSQPASASAASMTSVALKAMRACGIEKFIGVFQNKSGPRGNSDGRVRLDAFGASAAE